MSEADAIIEAANIIANAINGLAWAIVIVVIVHALVTD